MSNPEDNGEQPEKAAFQRLEAMVGKALDEISVLRARAEEAEARGAEFEELVKRFTQDEGEASRLLSRLERLEAENADLSSRLERGREGVERLLAKIRFLEEQK